jgi:hypothetical protein
VTRLQFWIFTVGSLVVAALVATDLIIETQVQTYNHRLTVLERVIPEGEESYELSSRIATRIYELSAQDPALKDLMTREQIIVKNTSPTPHPTPAPSPSPSSTKGASSAR